MRPLSIRTAGFTDSVIRRMTRICNRYEAINLSQGFPDFDPPQEITDRLSEIAHSGPHQYAITWGAQNFRAALAKKQSRWTGLPIDADKNIVVTCSHHFMRIILPIRFFLEQSPYIFLLFHRHSRLMRT